MEYARVTTFQRMMPLSPLCSIMKMTPYGHQHARNTTVMAASVSVTRSWYPSWGRASSNLLMRSFLHLLLSSRL